MTSSPPSPQRTSSSRDPSRTSSPAVPVTVHSYRLPSGPTSTSAPGEVPGISAAPPRSRSASGAARPFPKTSTTPVARPPASRRKAIKARTADECDRRQRGLGFGGLTGGGGGGAGFGTARGRGASAGFATSLIGSGASSAGLPTSSIGSGASS